MAKAHMKDDPDFFQHNSKAFEASEEELKGFVADIQAYESQIEDAKREMSDVFTIAKARGYDVKALRKTLAELKRNAQDLVAERETIEMYKQLLL